MGLIQYDQRHLKAHLLRETIMVPRELIRLEAPQEVEPYIDELMLSLSATVYGEELGERVITDWVPATWLDHWIRDKAPEWLRKRRPPNLVARQVVVKAAVLFPQWVPPRSRLGDAVITITEARLRDPLKPIR